MRAAQATDAHAGPSVDPAVDALRSAGEAAVQKPRERDEEAGIAVTTDVGQGTPASAIVEAAADGDVVVMGAHGRIGLDRYLVGSTTENVVRSAEVPVSGAGNDEAAAES